MKIQDISKATREIESDYFNGTSAYAPPEKLKSPIVLSSNAKHDIFSAGVVLFIMLTGHPPFQSAKDNDRHF